MQTNNTLAPIAKKTANYISKHNPKKLWQIAFEEMNEELAKSMAFHYYLVGEYIAGFFTGGDNPLDKLDDEKYTEFKKCVKLHANFFLRFWDVLYDGSKYVKKALIDAGYPSPVRLPEILIKLYNEELTLNLGFAIGDYESLSSADSDERFRVWKKFLNDELSTEKQQKTLEKWKQKDAKLLRNNYFSDNPKELLKLTNLCFHTLQDNREHLDNWKDFYKTYQMWYKMPSSKSLVSGGELNLYPSRWSKRTEHS